MTVVSLESIVRIRAAAAEVCEDVFRSPPSVTVSEWADENRMLPKTSAEPGRFRTDRVPYLRGVMDALGDETIRHVVFMKSAQVGGTTVGENFLGYLIDQAPCAILSVWPTEKKMQSWSKKNLKPLLEDTECLSAKFPRSRRREAGDTISSKEFPSGFLQLLTAKSSSDLRSTSARVAIAEEVDEWDDEIGDQGDPFEQLDARMRTFWNRKEYDVSTPTLEGFSRIASRFDRSTQHRYVVPCPHCDHRQILRWRDGKDDQDEAGAYRLVWERDADGEPIPGTVCYVCEGCGVLIEEHHKMRMLLAGEWVPTHPGRAIVGFHINTLYSPLCAWDDIAVAFTRAVKSPATMQTFVNLWLGLPYRAKGAAIDASFLAARAEDYGELAEDLGGGPIEVPRGVGVLTAFVDVQGDRLELFVWGWGDGEESWVIEWQQLNGDPGQDDVWAAVDARLQAPRRHASGAPIGISAVCVDAGYQTDRVHRFCDARRARHVIATVGRAGRPRKLIEAPNADKYKRAKSQKRPTHVIGIDSAKDLLASRLRLERKDDNTCPRGFVHFPATLDPVFYDQLTAERLVTDYEKGRPVRVWKVIEGRRNEALDGAVGAMAALEYLVLEKAIARTQLGARAEKFNTWQPPQQGPKESTTPKRRGGGWITNY